MYAPELSLSVTIRSRAVPIVIRVPIGQGSEPRSIAASSAPIVNSSFRAKMSRSRDLNTPYITGSL